MAQYTEAKVFWTDNSSGANDETGTEVQIYTDSPSFVATVPVDAFASHPWMKLLPAAAGQTEYLVKLETPVTFVKARVRQFNANGYGPWDVPSGTQFQVAQGSGTGTPNAPVSTGFQVVAAGANTPTPVTPGPTPNPVTTQSNYVFSTQFSSTQGQNQWSYRDTAGNLMTYNSTSGQWVGAQTYMGIWSTGFHPGSTDGAVLRWTAPAAGTALITGTTGLHSVGGSGAQFKINYNGSSDLFDQSMTGTTQYAYSETQAMSSGEYIDFIILPGATNSYDSTALTPVITFTTDGTTTSNPVVSTLIPATFSIPVGGTQSLQVTLTSAALSAATVTLNSSDATKATVPASVVIPAGQTSVQFLVTGVSAGSSTITATYNSTNKTSAATVSAAVSADWANAPIGGTVLVDHAFNTLLAPGAIDYYSGTVLTTDATAPKSASNVAKHRLEAYAGSGGSEYTINMASYRELYVGLYWRTNPQFQGRIVANKVFFIRSPDFGTNGYFGVIGGPNQGGGGFSWMWGHNTGGIDNSHIMAADSGLIAYSNVGNASVQMGVWYKMEFHIRASTTRTSRDGFIRWWVNGILVGSYNNLNYASSTSTAASPGVLNQFVWNETWDNNQDMGISNTVPWEHYVDHIYIVGKN